MLDAAEPPTAFADLVGYRLQVWERDYAEVTLQLEAKHLNRNGGPHGGLLATLIDTACGYAGVHCTVPGNHRRALTLSLTTQFIGRADPGSTLTAIGRKIGGGRQIFFASCEIRDQNGRLIAQGEGSFRYRRGSESPEGEPIR
jgi:uncharacterized protein (TIGR00369 family)